VELALGPSPGLKGKIFFYWFYIGNLKRAPDRCKISKSGAAGAPEWDTFHLQKFSAKPAFA
jgi:hypothetical protein